MKIKENSRVVLLGKSHYALSIILDMLPDFVNKVIIVPNIDDEENDSRSVPYKNEKIIDTVMFPEDFKPSDADKYFLASIGRSRRKIFKFFIDEFQLNPQNFPGLIAPSAVVGYGVLMGLGLHISPLSVIAPFSSLGDLVVINRNVSIGHHTKIENFATINPGVNIAGNCHIGANVIIGIGSTVIDGITIAENTIIGAGSLVTKDMPSGVVAYGNPAKIIRENG